MDKTARELTREHIRNVGKKLSIVSNHLMHKRLIEHDASKLQEPEVSVFDIYTEKLKQCTYGSDDYLKFLKELKPTLDHHYENNRHHPEHFTNGVNEMNLVDIVEMFCDWLAATERHQDGDIFKSIKINEERFGISPQLSEIFRNTARDIFNKGE